MRKNRFMILCAAVLLVLLSGGVIKHTLLGEARADLAWPYTVTYTVLVPDVDADTEEMFFRDMGLYMEDGTAVGTVVKIEREEAASGAEDCADLLLHVKATAAGERAREAEPTAFRAEEQVTFVSRFIMFSGTITGIEGD